jgi:hypothetical protein
MKGTVLYCNGHTLTGRLLSCLSKHCRPRSACRLLSTPEGMLGLLSMTRDDVTSTLARYPVLTLLSTMRDGLLTEKHHHLGTRRQNSRSTYAYRWEYVSATTVVERHVCKKYPIWWAHCGWVKLTMERGKTTEPAQIPELTRRNACSNSLVHKMDR